MPVVGTFRVDRMADVTVPDERFTWPADFSLAAEWGPSLAWRPVARASRQRSSSTCASSPRSAVRAGTDLVYTVALRHDAGTGAKLGPGDIDFVGDDRAPLFEQSLGGGTSPSYLFNWVTPVASPQVTRWR
jgi:hypothetical protein